MLKLNGSMGEKVKFNKRWFQNRLMDRSLSQAQAARLLNMQASALTRIFNGERRLQMDEAIELARIVSAPLDEVMLQAGMSLPASKHRATIRGVVEPDCSVHDGKRRGSVEAPMAGLEALDVPSKHWTLFYRESTSISPEAIGRMALVETRDGKRLVGHPQPGDRSRYNLAKLCGETLENLTLVSASPILWIRT